MKKVVLEKLSQLARQSTAKSRIDFLSIAFKHDLVDQIRDYRAWDLGYEIGPRDFDNCLESEDIGIVIRGLISCAERGGFLTRVVACFDEAQLAHWKMADIPSVQFQLPAAPTPQMCLF